MNAPRIHLIAPAGSCRPFFPAIAAASATELIDLVQLTVGTKYGVTGNAELIDAAEDERAGGRSDDKARAQDIEKALGDDAIVAVVAIRGGAWFTRILPLIDFAVLEHRTRPLAVFGFSELTTLVNIVGASTHGRGVYDMGPAFLTYGLKRFAAPRDETARKPHGRAEDPVQDRVRAEFEAFFRDVVSMIEGRGTGRAVEARLVRGDLAERCEALFVGGNLTVLSMLLGSAYEHCVRPAGRWLVLEDFNDKVERIDRFLAHLTLAGYWSLCQGILLGDFHKGYEDLTPAVLRLMERHIPSPRPVPILVTRQVGHIWPMSPLPLHVKVTIERSQTGSFAISWPANALRTA